MATLYSSFNFDVVADENVCRGMIYLAYSYNSSFSLLFGVRGVFWIYNLSCPRQIYTSPHKPYRSDNDSRTYRMLSLFGMRWPALSIRSRNKIFCKCVGADFSAQGCLQVHFFLLTCRRKDRGLNGASWMISPCCIIFGHSVPDYGYTRRKHGPCRQVESKK